jgi:hypothetical protein
MIFFVSFSNDHILAKKIGLLVVKSNNEYLIIALSALISALVSGLSALTGRSLAIVLKKS